MELFRITHYIYSWYKVLVHWKLKLLNFPIDAILYIFFLHGLLLSFLIRFINFKEIRDFLFLRKSRLYYFVTIYVACKFNFTKFANQYFMSIQLHKLFWQSQKKQRQAHVYLDFTSFQFINPFALWNFVAKTLFKAIQAIFCSLSVYKEVKITRKLCMGRSFWSKCKISASEVQVWTKPKIPR